MMTLEKTVDVTKDRNVHFDITLPEVAPLSGADLELEPELQAVLLSAAKKTAWRKAHPEEFMAQMKAVQSPYDPRALDGLSSVEYVRKIRDEWGD
jgi:hypothetical protein